MRLEFRSAGAIAGALAGAGLYSTLRPADALALMPLTLPLTIASWGAQGWVVAAATEVLGSTCGRLGAWAGLACLGVVGTLLTASVNFMLTGTWGMQWLAEAAIPWAALAVVTGSVVAARRIFPIAMIEPGGQPASLARQVTGPYVVTCLAIWTDIHRFALLTLMTRPFLVGILVGTCGLAAAGVARTSSRTAARFVAAAVLTVAAITAAVFVATSFRRLYDAMHVAAFVCVVWSVAQVAAPASRGLPARPSLRCAALAAILMLVPLASDSGRFELLERRSPLGRWVRRVGVGLGPLFLPPPVETDVLLPPTVVQPTDPPHPDVVLLTVDTLRADRVRRDLMPRLRAHLERAAYFEHARTPHPSTFLALRAATTGVHSESPEAANSRHDTSIFHSMRAAGYQLESWGAFVEQMDVIGRFDSVHSLGRRDDPGHAAEFIGALGRLRQLDRPFLVWLHLDRPHHPYSPTRRPVGAGAAELYDGCVRDSDELVGEVLDRLELLRRSRDVLVVFFADHGEEFGDHGGQFHYGSVYDELLRVPLAFWGPGVRPGRRPEAVSLTDLAPTLAELTGVGGRFGRNGRSVAGAVRGEDIESRFVVSDVFLNDRAEDSIRLSGRIASRAIVLEPWKLIANRVSGTLELYRLDTDPGELHNRIRDAHLAPPELLRAHGLHPGGE